MEQNSLVTIDNGEITLPQDSPVGLYLSTLTKNSRVTMQYALHQIALIVTSGKNGNIFEIPFWKLSIAEISLLKNTIMETRSIRTTGLYLASIKGVIKSAWRLGYISAEQYQRLTDVQNPKGNDPEKGRALTPREIKLLLDSCPETIKGIRDRTILMILLYSGLRRFECSKLRIDNLLKIEYDGKFGYSLQVDRGKGGKSRVLYLNEDVANCINKWLEIRTDQPGFLFPRLSNLKNLESHISPQSIYDMLGDLSIKSGVSKFSPHDLRRSFATQLLSSGYDLSSVQKLMGHSSPVVTGHYDKRGNKQIQEANLGLNYDIEP